MRIEEVKHRTHRTSAEAIALLLDRDAQLLSSHQSFTDSKASSWACKCICKTIRVRGYRRQGTTAAHMRSQV